jgi:CHAD domain-containing protein
MKLRCPFADAVASSREEARQQFQLILGLEKATAAGQVAALHDFRVALRRLRLLLRALAGPLAPTDAGALERRWQRLADELSPLRDADVWRGLLRELPGATATFRRRVAAKLHSERGHPAAVLKRAAWRRLKRDTHLLMAHALPDALAKAGPAKLGKALRRAWEQAGARAARLAQQRHLAEPEQAHKLRIACRRVRYLAEFFAAAVAGRKKAQAWQELAGQYRALQNALGRTHDADVLLEFLQTAGLRPPLAVVRSLRARRAAGVRQFKQVWREMVN